MSQIYFTTFILLLQVFYAKNVNIPFGLPRYVRNDKRTAKSDSLGSLYTREAFLALTPVGVESASKACLMGATLFVELCSTPQPKVSLWNPDGEK